MATGPVASHHVGTHPVAPSEGQTSPVDAHISGEDGGVEPSKTISCEDRVHCDAACTGGHAGACLKLAKLVVGPFERDGVLHSYSPMAAAHRPALAPLERACDLGSAEGCGAWLDGLLIVNDRPARDNTLRAMAVFAEGCLVAEDVACFGLAGALASQDTPREKRDPSRAAVLYEELCERNHHEACYRRATFHAHEVPFPPRERVLHLLHKGCAEWSGSLHACLEEGRQRCKADMECLRPIATRGCELGDEASCGDLTGIEEKAQRGPELAAAARRGCRLGSAYSCSVLEKILRSQRRNRCARLIKGRTCDLGEECSDWAIRYEELLAIPDECWEVSR